MNKTVIKKTKLINQQHRDAIDESVILSVDQSLNDIDRIVPKAEGGNINLDNTRLLHPVEHMKLHGNYKEREESMNKLKGMMDARQQMIKLFISANNRMLAHARQTDNVDSKTIEWLQEKSNEVKKELSSMDRRITKHLNSMPHEIIKSAMEIKGLGPISIAYILVYVDIGKARYASSLWAYVGLDKASHERYKKNEAGGGNKTLRTALYAMAESFIKSRSIYRDIYDNEKLKLSASEKVTKSRNTQGQLIECKWKDTKPSHRHGAAIRKMIKHFLADFWYVWRTLEGLQTPLLYPEAKLGHKGIVRPEERGWKF